MDVGDKVIATDPWYGTYTGSIVGFRQRYHSDRRVDVLITTCISPPSMRAILNPDASFRRVAYAPGEIRHFGIDEVSLIGKDSTT